MTGVKTSPADLERRMSGVLARFRYVKAATVYGSVAAGTARPDSDLDVGIVGARPLTASQHIALIGALAMEFGRPIDLVDLRTVRGPVLREALANGRVVYRKDPHALGEVIYDMLIYEADEAPIFNRAAQMALERCLRTF